MHFNSGKVTSADALLYTVGRQVRIQLFSVLQDKNSLLLTSLRLYIPLGQYGRPELGGGGALAQPARPLDGQQELPDGYASYVSFPCVER